MIGNSGKPIFILKKVLKTFLNFLILKPNFYTTSYTIQTLHLRQNILQNRRKKDGVLVIYFVI